MTSMRKSSKPIWLGNGYVCGSLTDTSNGPSRTPTTKSDCVVCRSLTDAQRARPVSSERTQLVELRALGSTGSSAEGALGDGPEPDELADFGSAVPWPADVPAERPLRCGRRVTVPWRTLLCRGVCYVVQGGRVFFCSLKSAPAFPGVPSCSFLFPRGLCRDCWEV
jgi:hypothetical protein